MSLFGHLLSVARFSRDSHRYIRQNKKVYPLGLADPSSKRLVLSPGNGKPTHWSKWSSFRHSGGATFMGSKQMGLACLVLREQFTHLEEYMCMDPPFHSRRQTTL
ncbi:unnamed protein product, partial [Dicrocoelium dendriticum]